MLRIRAAVREDVPTMLRFIRELAEFEREPEAVVATEADLLRDGWSEPVRFRALMAEWVEPGGCERVGFALYFTSYSTWLGHHGIRLEDLYVTPEARRRGVGRALLAELARIAVSEGCGRLEWDVLAWNQGAIDVYAGIGAGIQTEWRIMRLSGERLAQLAASTLKG